MRATILACFFFASLPAQASSSALVEAECARAIALAEGRVAGSGIPYLTLDSRVDPEAEKAREESLRVGLAVNLSDLARRSRASARGEADCERIRAKARAAGAEASARLSVLIAGLSARREAISASLVTAEKTLADRKRRLGARQETRARVDAVARTVAVLRQDLLDADVELSRVRRNAEGLGAPPHDTANLLAAAATAAAASARATEDDVRGPAWDFTVGAGWAKKRTHFEGETYYSTGQPYYAQVGIAWRPGVAFTRGAEADVVKGEIAPLETAAAAWDAERQDLVRMYEAKLALVAERLASVRADHAVAAASRLPDALVFADRLAQDEQGLAADEADWKARLVVLAAAPSAPQPPKPESSFSSISRVDTLTFTEGKADSSTGGTFTTKSPKIRARAEGAKGSRKLTAHFTYVGPTAKIEKLASGAERRQLGVFLAAKDQCNLLYVMWRLPDEIVVQKKLNPGKATHDACGNDGYATIKPEKSAAAPTLKPGQKHTLSATLSAGRLDVEIDGQAVWSGLIDVSGLDPATGDAGWRSDNVEAAFSLARAGDAP